MREMKIIAPSDCVLCISIENAAGNSSSYSNANFGYQGQSASISQQRTQYLEEDGSEGLPEFVCDLPPVRNIGSEVVVEELLELINEEDPSCSRTPSMPDFFLDDFFPEEEPPEPNTRNSMLAVVAEEPLSVLNPKQSPEEPPPVQTPSKGKLFIKKAASGFFYVSMAIIILSALVFSGKGGEVKRIGPIALFTVLTESMKDERPPGTLIISMKTDGKNIKVDDVVTFHSAGGSSVVTHRVVATELEGMTRKFQTKGDNNTEPDKEWLPEDRLIGKEIYHKKDAGIVIQWMQSHLILILIIFAVLMALSFSLQYVFAKDLNQLKHKHKKEPRKD